MQDPAELERDLALALRLLQSKERVPSVSAAAAHDGEILWSEAVGLAELEGREQATTETQYRIGSITKTFTAAAVLKVRDEGGLDLDDEIGQHVSEWPHAGVTIRLLLVHGAGIQRELPGVEWENLRQPSRAELIAGLADAKVVLRGARHWHYSNLAFALLGEAVSRLAGIPYERYVDDAFLHPLGLERTTWEAAHPAAQPYIVDPYADRAEAEADLSLSGGAAAGDLWSTPSDLCRWGSFLVDPDPAILAAETVEEMHAVQIMIDLDRWTAGWGLGLSLNRKGDRVFAGHEGGMPGFVAGLAYSRKEKAVAAALTNAYGPAHVLALELAEKTAEAFPREPAEWQAGEGAPPELAGVLGRWWSEGRETIFSYRHGRLEASQATDAPGHEPSVFEPEGPDAFRVVSGRERGEELRVVRDERGEVVKLDWATYPFLRTARPFGPST